MSTRRQSTILGEMLQVSDSEKRAILSAASDLIGRAETKRLRGWLQPIIAKLSR